MYIVIISNITLIIYILVLVVIAKVLGLLHATTSEIAQTNYLAISSIPHLEAYVRVAFRSIATLAIIWHPSDIKIVD